MVHIFLKYLCLVANEGLLEENNRDLNIFLSVFRILIVAMHTQIYAFIETHQTVYLKWLHLVVCELYLDKGGFYVSILAALDLHGGAWAFSSGGVWASLVHMDSLVAALRLSCPKAWGILVPWPGIEPMSYWNVDS